MTPEQYYSLPSEQQYVIQEIKKCFKRIRNKNNETTKKLFNFQEQ